MYLLCVFTKVSFVWIDAFFPRCLVCTIFSNMVWKFLLSTVSRIGCGDFLPNGYCISQTGATRGKGRSCKFIQETHDGSWESSRRWRSSIQCLMMKPNLYINRDKACIISMISVAFSQSKCLVVDMEIQWFHSWGEWMLLYLLLSFYSSRMFSFAPC